MSDWFCSQPGCGKLHSEHLREKAERRVLAARDSYDAPGFEACVEAELAEMRELERKKQ